MPSFKQLCLLSFAILGTAAPTPQEDAYTALSGTNGSEAGVATYGTVRPTLVTTAIEPGNTNTEGDDDPCAGIESRREFWKCKKMHRKAQHGNKAWSKHKDLPDPQDVPEFEATIVKPKQFLEDGQGSAPSELSTVISPVETIAPRAIHPNGNGTSQEGDRHGFKGWKGRKAYQKDWYNGRADDRSEDPEDAIDDPTSTTGTIAARAAHGGNWGDRKGNRKGFKKNWHDAKVDGASKHDDDNNEDPSPARPSAGTIAPRSAHGGGNDTSQGDGHSWSKGWRNRKGFRKDWPKNRDGMDDSERTDFPTIAPREAHGGRNRNATGDGHRWFGERKGKNNEWPHGDGSKPEVRDYAGFPDKTATATSRESNEMIAARALAEENSARIARDYAERKEMAENDRTNRPCNEARSLRGFRHCVERSEVWVS